VEARKKRSISPVSQASRLALFFARRPKRNALGILFRFIATMTSLTTAFADPLPSTLSTPTATPAAPGVFATVGRLGEPEQEAALREGQLLSHRRATDPFGNIIRGPYKALPVVVEHPTPVVQPSAAQAAPVADVPTMEKAVQGLAIGAVNVGAHEILIGSRSIREGDLLVLESGGQKFVVWVQNIGVRGVSFCDINMQEHHLKSFGTGPQELPGDSVRGTTDLRHFLNQDASP
jgi:hypothetical protein